jgi:flavoprotein
MPSPDSNWLSRAFSWRPAAWRPGDDDLHHCAHCGRDFVNPVDWEPVTPEAWWMLLRCGECQVWREVTVTNAVAERFDVELDRRADILQRTLHKLDLERMAQQAEAMIAALRRGLIDPADFAY